MFLDPAILQDLEPWKKGVDKIGKVLIGQTKTFLDGTSCASGECNLGDLVADAEVYHVSSLLFYLYFE